MFEKGQILRINNTFWLTQLNGENINTKIFHLKVSLIELNSAFLLFWSIFGEIQRELLFLVQKVTISERYVEIFF